MNVGFGIDVGDGLVLKAHSHFAVASRVSEIDELRFAESQIQRIDACELELVSFLFVGCFCRRMKVDIIEQPSDVGMPGLISHNAKFSEVESGEVDSEFVVCKSPGIHLHIQFRYIQEKGATEFRQVVDLEILDSDDRRKHA